MGLCIFYTCCKISKDYTSTSYIFKGYFMPQLYLIDGSSYIYRAFHAMKGLSTSRGMPTNAVYIFTNMILKILNEMKPQFLAIAFDPKGPTTRHKTYKEYKAQRPPMPDTLSVQVPYIYRIVEALNIPILMIEGIEADDVIGSVAKKGETDGYEVIIVTGDKDMFQLISSHIRIYDPMKGKIYEEKDVIEKFGVPPAKITEIMALMGDPIDNIPGVKGVGEKTAKELILQFGDIDNLLGHLEKIKKAKLRQLLEKEKDNILLSKDLARIDTTIPVQIDYESLKVQKPHRDKLLSLFRELEFSSLLKAFPDLMEKPEGIYRKVKDKRELKALLSSLHEEVSVFIKDEMADPFTTTIRGVGISCKDGEGWFIPIKEAKGIQKDIFMESDRDEMAQHIFSIFTDPGLKKITHDVKRHIILLKRYGINPAGFVFDTMIASYLINPNKPDHSLKSVVLEYLLQAIPSENEATDIPLYISQCADYIWQLRQPLEEDLRATEVDRLFYEIEMPLTEVLAYMEMNGVKVDREILEGLSEEFTHELDKICNRIYSIAGEEFNINSPRQLSKILFEKLKLKPLRKTKTGYSTDEAVLTELASHHELPAEILNYRQIAKLKSTYVDGLLAMINPDTGRIHTSFSQAITATGRLSSSKPNLQNIPIRTEMGQRIREAFVAEEGHYLLAADYSQIELRILAHMSGDEIFIGAFQRNEDIHTRTASEIFGVPPEEVTPEMRRRAKAINFGIVYGMSPHGLSMDIGISYEEAKRYIDNYFAKHKGVKAFIHKTLKEAKERGYVTTLFNRRRYLPELKSPEASIRQAGERIAINTPIQGSAADIIKLAMIKIYKRLRELDLKSKMILQIHDELLFEVPHQELEEVKKIVVKEMEGAISLAVPLKVDIGIGRNWREAG